MLVQCNAGILKTKKWFINCTPTIVEHHQVANIPCVPYFIRATKVFPYFRVQKAVGVRNQSDFHPLKYCFGPHYLYYFTVMESRVEQFRIRVSEVDNNRQLSISALVSILQEIAWNHAHDLGVSVYDLLEKNLTWVLVRMKIELDDLPGHGDTLTVETWPSGIERLFVFRNFKMTVGDREIGRVLSSWLVFDTKLRGVVRVPQFIASNVASQNSDWDRASGNIEKLSEIQFEKNFQVRLHETDVNQHTNNTSYFQWIIESVPTDHLKSHRLSSLEIVFKAESVLDDKIRSRSGPSGPNRFLHQIVNQEGVELVRALTQWA